MSLIYVFFQILPISDNNGQEHDDAAAIADDGVLVDNVKDVKTTVEGNVNETNATHDSDEPKDIGGDLSRHKPVTSEAVYETSSDEGWQEANSKGRSGNGANRKSGRRQRPNLSKLSIHKETSYRNDTTSLPQKGAPKVTSALLSPSRQSKTSKALLSSKISSSPASLSSLASKSISYKEVAVAPPGTVLKPLLEKTEVEKVNDENETQKQEASIEKSIAEAVQQQDEKEVIHDESEKESSASELEKVSLSSDQTKPTETNGSKLSAAAKPFSPGTLSASRHLNPVPVASIYDANGSQGILVEPVLPPAAARVPCGPRSPLYYRTNYTFRMKHGSSKIREISGSGGPRIMNPHAPEFVPRSASQIETSDANSNVSSDENKSSPSKHSLSESEKSEIARQILLSFLVKSVHQNADAVDEAKITEGEVEDLENSSDEVAKDSAVIKITYGTDEKNKTVVNSSDDGEEQDKLDGEGFVVVTNRRKSRQKITNGVPELYNQQSICASVR